MQCIPLIVIKSKRPEKMFNNHFLSLIRRETPRAESNLPLTSPISYVVLIDSATKSLSESSIRWGPSS